MKLYAMVMIEVDKIEELHFKQINAKHSKLGFTVLSTFEEFSQDFDDICETERWTFKNMQWHGFDKWEWRATYEEHGLSDESHVVTGDVYGELPHEIGNAINAKYIEIEIEDEGTYVLSYTRPWADDPDRAPQSITVELTRKEG